MSLLVFPREDAATYGANQNGTTSLIRTKLGNCDLDLSASAITMVAICRIGDNSASWRNIMAGLSSAGVVKGWAIERNNGAGRFLVFDTNTSSVVSTLSFQQSDGWGMIAVSRAAGATVSPFFYKYIYATNVFSSDVAGAAATANGGPGVGGSVELGGKFGTATDWFVGDWFMGAVWAEQLTQAQIRSLAYADIDYWLRTNPRGMWMPRAGESVHDLTNNGAEEYTRTAIIPSIGIPPIVYNKFINKEPLYDTVAASGTAYTDSATATITLVPSGADTAQFVDAATATVALVPSAIENAQFVDNSTATLVIKPSSADVFGGIDAATVPIALTPSAVEFPAKEYTDSGTANIVLTVSGSDTSQFVDAGTSVVVIQPSGTEQQASVESGTASITLLPSGTDTAQFVDANTANVLISPSSVEVFSGVDAVLVPISIVPSGTEQVSGNTTDAGTAVVALVPSSTEAYTAVDSAIASVNLVPSGTENREITDAGVASINLVPSGIDTLTATDSGQARVTLTVSGTESAVFTDAGTSTILISPSGNELREITDVGTASVVLTPTGIENYVRVDAATVPIKIEPAAGFTFLDGGTATVSIRPLIKVDVHLVVIFQRWYYKVIGRRWSFKGHL